MKLFRVEKISMDEVDSTFSEAWVELLNQAPQASFFSQLHYLKTIQNIFQRKIELWYIFADHIIRAGGVLFPHPRFGSVITSLYYCPYTDILIRELDDEKLPNKLIRRNRVYNSFRQFIEKNYYYSRFNFSPKVADLREFINASGWNVNVSYSQWVNLPDIQTAFNNILKGERRQIRNFSYDGNIVTDFDPTEFVNLIFLSYERHHIAPPLDRKSLINWVKGLKHLAGIESIGLVNSENQLKSGRIWAEFKNDAYFLLEGSNLDDGVSFSPYLYFKNFELLTEKGINRVDLLGGNQDTIAKFKIKMGGQPVPRFNLTYSKTKLSSIVIDLVTFFLHHQRKI